MIYLWVNSNKNPNMVKELITQKCYPQLLKLSLVGNQIDSIEALQFLNAPNLEVVDSGVNKITSTRSLGKLNLKKMKELYLSYN